MYPQLSTKQQPFNAIVSKNKKPGAYRTVTEAIAAAPVYSATKYYIHVEAGLYKERVEVWKNKLTNIVLVGDGQLTTKISWNRRAPYFRTYDTATVLIRGDGFIAKFLTFENSAGDGSQAVAVASLSNQSAFFQCTFLGYQDTLHPKRGFQFYRECNIYGTVDFIFGAAAAIFQSCNLFSRLPSTITFTAQNKQDTNITSGFVIQNCTFTVAPGMERQKPLIKAYLGRPWSDFSTVVVMESYLDDIIQPTGWLSWGNTTTDKLTYYEFRNHGPGAATSKRVN
ncbi:putative pectinesterase/pectinesterase inhibitor 22 [Sesamum alatum]|uniref:Pectinesterase n=1 Tax=Sesamum alatum TaxID=300844 RepID=A0AAE1Y2B3_9LAMI|nr:putative pectinesterase/pectinesterase inhibitor 22 [Sesamum alatum]